MDKNKDVEREDAEAVARMEKGRIILWVVAGAYLLFLAYQLGRGLVISAMESNSETVAAWCACVVFVIVGVVLLVLALRSWLRISREKKDER